MVENNFCGNRDKDNLASELLNHTSSLKEQFNVTSIIFNWHNTLKNPWTIQRVFEVMQEKKFFRQYRYHHTRRMLRQINGTT